MVPPKPPSSLKQAGKKRWKEIWEAASGWLGPSDAPSVEEVCKIADELAALKTTISKTKNPGMKLQHAYRYDKKQERLMAFYGLLGLNPSARAKLGLTVAQAENEASRLNQFTNRAG